MARPDRTATAAPGPWVSTLCATSQRMQKGWVPLPTVSGARCLGIDSSLRPEGIIALPVRREDERRGPRAYRGREKRHAAGVNHRVAPAELLRG